MLILCHRGYHVDAPENTIASFEEAIKLGIDGIETDVQLCGDGHPILFHERFSPDGRSVRTLSRQELSSQVGYDVPTLEQALRLSEKAPRNFLWNFEIKNPDAAGPAVSAIKVSAHRTNILITSFWHGLIDEISLNNDLTCGLLVAHCPLPFKFRPSWLPSRQNARTIVWFFDRAEPDILRNAKSWGMRNFIYGPISSADHDQLTKWDVDGVITDYPNRACSGNGEAK